MAEPALIVIASINLGFLVVGIGWVLGYWSRGGLAILGLALFMLVTLLAVSTTADEDGVSPIEAVGFALVVFVLLAAGHRLSIRARS